MHEDPMSVTLQVIKLAGLWTITVLLHVHDCLIVAIQSDDTTSSAFNATRQNWSWTTQDIYPIVSLTACKPDSKK